jgi:hypothetical protein
MTEIEPGIAPPSAVIAAPKAEPKLAVPSFAELVDAHWNVHRISVRDQPDPEHVRKLRQVRTAFEAFHGTIVESCFGAVDALAAVLTDRGELFIDTARSGTIALWPGMDDLLHRCQVLHIEAKTVLVGDARRICMQLVFSVICYSVSAIDRFAWYTQQSTKWWLPRGVTQAEARAQAQQQAELMYARAATYQTRVTQRQTRGSYIVGMLSGIAVVMAVSAAVGVIEIIVGQDAFWSVENYQMQVYGWAIVTGGAGALGATVSVLQRLTQGSLVLDPTASEGQAKLLGAARVFLGAVFGFALYSLLMAELLPIAVPDDARPLFYFVLILAFLAGFSERFAQDALAVTTRRFLGDAEESVRPVEVGVPVTGRGRPDGQIGPASQEDGSEADKTSEDVQRSGDQN